MRAPHASDTLGAGSCFGFRIAVKLEPEERAWITVKHGDQFAVDDRTPRQVDDESVHQLDRGGVALTRIVDGVDRRGDTREVTRHAHYRFRLRHEPNIGLDD